MFAHLNVVVYINTIITAFEFNFDIYQAFRKHEYTLTLKQRETVNKQLFYFQWKLVILKNFEILKSKLKSKIPFYCIDINAQYFTPGISSCCYYEKYQLFWS